MGLQTYHAWEANGKRYRAVYDEDFQVCNAFAYETREATKAAEEELIRNVNSGKWVVLGILVSEPCKVEKHCDCCKATHGHYVETDSLWGIIVDNSHKAIEEFARTSM